MNGDLSSDPRANLTYLSKPMNQEIRYHWKRSGLPAWKILGLVNPRPDRLTIMILNDWIAYRVRWVNQDDWNAVLAVWKDSPDANLPDQQDHAEYRRVGYPPNVEGTTRLDVTPQMFQTFMTELERTGAEVKLDLVDAENAPEGLNERVIQIFRRQEAKTIRSDYWEFMIATLASMPDQESIL
jgi:hypothetical protein